jgi:hypothetical protein
MFIHTTHTIDSPARATRAFLCGFLLELFLKPKSFFQSSFKRLLLELQSWFKVTIIFTLSVIAIIRNRLFPLHFPPTNSSFCSLNLSKSVSSSLLLPLSLVLVCFFSCISRHFCDFHIGSTHKPRQSDSALLYQTSSETASINAIRGFFLLLLVIILFESSFLLLLLPSHFLFDF